MNTLKIHTGEPLTMPPYGMEPTKEEMCRRIQILEECLQAVLDKMGEECNCTYSPLMVCIPKGFKMTILKEDTKAEI